MAGFDKYSNIYDDLGLKPEFKNKISRAKVLIMGAGSLGSGVIATLAQFGIGQIKIIDHAVIEEKNLNFELIHKNQNTSRAKVISAKEWIHEFNPDIKVELDKIKLNELNYFNVIQNYDIIVDCFNDSQEKYILNEIALRHNKILIHGATQGFFGQVTTIIPDETGCLNCIMPKPSVFKKENYAKIPSTIGIISNLMSQEVIKVVCGTGNLLANKMLVYDGIKGEFKTINYTKIITCEICQNEINKQYQRLI